MREKTLSFTEQQKQHIEKRLEHYQVCCDRYAEQYEIACEQTSTARDYLSEILDDIHHKMRYLEFTWEVLNGDLVPPA